MTWLERRLGRARGVPVPRTDLLTDVTTEDPVADPGPQVRCDRAAILDCERADAAAGVEHPRLHERAGRAGVEAGGAGAAVVHLERRVGRQVEVGEQRREQKVAAGAGIDEHRVLAEPAQPGEAGEIPLGQRRRIDDRPGATSRHPGLEPRREGIRPRAEQIVIVIAPCVPRQASPPLLRRGRGGAGRRMVGGQHDHASRPRQERGGMGPQRLVPLEPALHRSGEALTEPAAELLVVRGRPCRGYPQPREPKPDRLGPQILHDGCGSRRRPGGSIGGEGRGGWHGPGKRGWCRRGRSEPPRGNWSGPVRGSRYRPAPLSPTAEPCQINVTRSSHRADCLTEQP